jgi:hypothetical protein
MQPNSSFIGSWRLTLQPDEGTEHHFALASFMDDWVVITSPPPVEQFPLAPEGIVHLSAGHGVWEPASERAAEMTFNAQSMDGQGRLIGIGTVRARMDLDDSGDTYTGRYAFEIAGADEQVFATETGTIRAARIVLLQIGAEAMQAGATA